MTDQAGKQREAFEKCFEECGYANEHDLAEEMFNAGAAWQAALATQQPPATCPEPATVNLTDAERKEIGDLSAAPREKEEG
jgi:hypothetical protein